MYPTPSMYSLGKQCIQDITGKSFTPEELKKNKSYFQKKNDKAFDYGIGGQSAFPPLSNSNEEEQITPVSTSTSSENTLSYGIYQKGFSQQSMTNTSTSSSTASRKVGKGPNNTTVSTAHTESHTSVSNQGNSRDSCCGNSSQDDSGEVEAEGGGGGGGRDRNRVNIYGHFKAYKCFHCSKSFNRRTYLKSHERVHSGEKPFTCIYCHKSFAQRTNLRSHERTHTGEKPYMCLVCQRSFCQLNELRSHERVHTGARPYQCPYCPKAFTQLTNLRNHIRTHTGEKPYVCMICTRSFAQHNELKSHERIHTGEKPYTCSLCSKAFSQRTNLRNHERVHSGEKPYQCMYCAKSFSQRGTLKNHELTHTLDKSTSRKSQKAGLAAQCSTHSDSESTGIEGSEKPHQHSTEHDTELIQAASAAEEVCRDEDEEDSQMPNTKYQSSSKWTSSTGSIPRAQNSFSTSSSSSTSSSMNLPRTAHTNNLDRSCMRQDQQQEPQSSSMRFQQIPSIPSMLVTPPYLHQMAPGWENSYSWSRGFSMASGWPSGNKNLAGVNSHEGKLRKHRGIAEKGKNTNSFDIRKEIHSNTK